MLGQGVPKTYTTWNPSDKGAGMVLSGSNLVVTTTGGFFQKVRATIGKSSGKWYWEVSLSGTTGGFEAGIAIGGTATTTELGDSGAIYEEIGFLGVSGTTVYSKTAGTATVISGASGFSSGDIMGFALDMDAKTIRIYKNNTLFADNIGANLLTNTYYPAVGTRAGGEVYTANFGASAFVYTPPSGFNAGVYL